MPAAIDLTGQRFGRLVVTGEAPHIRGERAWATLCDCGKTGQSTTGKLRGGNTSSCGCLAIDNLRARRTTHGCTGTPEHSIWMGITKRCTYQGDRCWPLYGGRGIRVCDEWQGPVGFAAFLAHVGPRPSPQHSIDRIDSDGHYEPGNVRWAPPDAQANNKRNSRHLTAFGMTLTLAQWAVETGICRKTLAYRLHIGMTMEQALDLPVDKSRTGRPKTHTA